jgi:glyoxylase-like metal-dependent hydrolase (beta-lactamase superfamily II)
MPITHPFEEPPAPGTMTEVSPGIFWARLPLPFRLDHVNVYLIEDEGGWAIMDCGIANAETRAIWRALLSGPLKGQTITKVIVTHFHPDHIGLAGWLCELVDAEMWTTRVTFLNTMTLAQAPALLEATPYRDFYRGNGMTPDVAEIVATNGHGYLRMISAPPKTFRRIKAGDVLKLGGRHFQVMTGQGHAPEQIMLYLPDNNVFLAADQVIEKITPNVSVQGFEPASNPLGEFLETLKGIIDQVPEDAFVLSGHRLPFHGLHERCEQMIAHHDERCDIIRQACAKAPQSAADLMPQIFPQQLTPHELSFAFTEVLAHVNHLVDEGELDWITDGELRKVKPVV